MKIRLAEKNFILLPYIQNHVRRIKNKFQTMAYCRRYLRIQKIDKTSSKAKESIKEKSFEGYFYD